MKILLIVSLILAVISIAVLVFIRWSRRGEYIDSHPDLLAKFDEIEDKCESEIRQVKEICSFIMNTEERLEKFVERHTINSRDEIKINMVDRVVTFKDGSDIDLEDITTLLVVNDKYYDIKRDFNGEQRIEHDIYTLHIGTTYTVDNIIKIHCGEDKDKAYAIKDDLEKCINDENSYNIPIDISNDLTLIESKKEYLASLEIGDISKVKINKNFERGVCNKLRARYDSELQRIYKEHRENTTKR